MRAKFKIKLLPQGKIIYAERGQTLVSALSEGGISINLPCGGHGICGKCRVQIKKFAPIPTNLEEKYLTVKELKKGIRLACINQVDNDLELFIPPLYRLYSEKGLHQEEAFRRYQFNPFIKKVDLKLKYLTSNTLSLTELLTKALNTVGRRDSNIPIEIVRCLPALIKKNISNFSCVLDEDKLLFLGEKTNKIRCLGLAIDIGTTTVSASLVDLEKSVEITYASRANPQNLYGQDLVARIDYTLKDAKNIKKLRNLIINCLNEIIDELIIKAKLNKIDIYNVLIVGNTTMHHFLLGISPESLSKAPYIPAETRPLQIQARELGLNINPLANVRILSNLGSFVGSDALSVILACSLDRNEKPRLAIDIGTNGEIILGNKDKILVASAAAGPAFEGQSLSCGSLAVKHAIEGIVIKNKKKKLKIIQSNKAKSICGSGIIDAVRYMLDEGVINKTGKSRKDKFVLYKDSDTEVFITQSDIRKIQLAKAAISAGIKILCNKFRIDYETIDELFLAGNFGNYMDPESAVKIGLIPPMPLNKIKFVGNAAISGCKLCLTSKNAYQKAIELTKKIKHIRLESNKRFQKEFIKRIPF